MVCVFPVSVIFKMFKGTRLIISCVQLVVVMYGGYVQSHGVGFLGSCIAAKPEKPV